MLRTFYLFCLLSTFPIFAESDESPAIPKGETGSPDIELMKPVAHLDGEPSGVVNNCVSVIAGDYCDTQMDLALVGPEALVIERSYVSSDPGKGFMYHGWKLNHEGKMYCHHSDRHHELDFYDRFGAFRCCRGRRASSRDESSTLKIKQESLSRGITNNSSGMISARTNLRNLTITYNYLKKKCSVQMPDGSKRVFKDKDDGEIFYAKYDVSTRGHYTNFEFNSDRFISGIQSKNSEGVLFSDVNFTYHTHGEHENHPKVDLVASDGRKVVYRFDRKKHANFGGKGYYLTSVVRPNAPDEKYAYEDHTHRIIRKDRPDQRFLKIYYYDENHNDVGGIDVKVKSTNEPKYKRVMMLKAPVGVDSEPIITHRFFYDLRTEKKKRGRKIALGGATEVRDALNHKTIFRFSDQYRLESVEKYLDDDSLYSVERLFWAGDDTPNQTNLTSRFLQSGDGTGQFLLHYQYDVKGNIIQEQLFGNLSGWNTASPVVEKSGSPEANGCEVYTKDFVYNKQNLMVEESDGSRTITFSYIHGKDLLASKFTWGESAIQIREFFEYDVNGVCIREITDDGKSDDKNDLFGVTERHIKEIQPTETYPIGLPEVVTEKCLDLASKQEVQLKRVHNTYSKEGWLLQEQLYDANNEYVGSKSWEYDPMGNVTKETDLLGNQVTRRYDDNGNIVYEQGPGADVHKEFTYDFSNRLICGKEIFTDGTILTTTHQYDYLSNRVATTDIYGNETKCLYDEFGRQTSIIKPQVADDKGNLESLTILNTYDLMGNVTSQTDPRGFVAKTKYNIRNKPCLIEYPDGTKETFTYRMDGELTESVGRNGLLTRCTYDYQKRLIKKERISPEGKTLSAEQWIYNVFHLLQEIDGEGNVTSYSYDSAGRVASQEKGDHCTTYEYDSLGRCCKTYEYCSETEYALTVQEFDLLGRVVEERIEDSSGKILQRQKYSYDAEGNRTEVINYLDSGIAVTTTVYNSHKLPIQITDPLGVQTLTHIFYDRRNDYNQVVPYVEMIDGQGNVTVKICDSHGKTASVIRKNPLGTITQMQKIYYDPSGNVVRTVDCVIEAGKQKREVVNLFDYDALNREVKRIESANSSEQKVTVYCYNSFGQKETTVKPDGVEIHYLYDALGRLQSFFSSDNTVHYVYTYDKNDNPIEIADPVNNRVTRKRYDGNQRLVEEELGNGCAMCYAYDRKGRPVLVTLPDESHVEYSYDPCRLREIRRHSHDGLTYQHAYTQYDLSGNVLEMETEAGLFSFQYDLLGRVKEICAPGWKEEVDAYDKVGNLTSRTIQEGSRVSRSQYEYDDLYQLTKETGDIEHSYLHDSLYNRTSKDGTPQQLNGLNQCVFDGSTRYHYDANGNMVGIDDAIRFEYDALDRLKTVVNGDTKIGYTYDELNRRLTKASYHRQGDGWKMEKCDNFLFQGDNEVGICDAEGHIVELRVLGTGKGAEIGAAAACEFHGEVYIPVHDHGGNVTALLDRQGKVCESYRYTAFGEETIFNSFNRQIKTSINPWRFSSKRVDQETGFVFFGRRYYIPVLGRWLTPDPAGFDGGPNLYAFVMNNPLTHIDLWGLFAQSSSQRRHSILCRTTYAFGRILQGIGDHCIPIPIVRDVVSLAGHLFSRRTLSHFHPTSHAQHSDNYHLGRDEATNKVSNMSVNGILASLSDAFAFARYCSDTHGGTNIHFTFNATHGFISDILECAAQILGIPTRSADKLADHIRERIDAVGGVDSDGRVNIYAHSQGGLVLDRALQQLSPEEKKMLHVTTFGSASLIDSKGLGGAANYVNSRDAVPFIANPISMIKGIFSKNSNIHFLPSKTYPFIDHQILSSDNYKRELNRLGYKFIQNYGVVN
ncbi:MAG: tRNA nuclease WapA [Chlamydiae bacterium]|nr:tRNA nuclease WapA [Chlamydiota bacterium]